MGMSDVAIERHNFECHDCHRTITGTGNPIATPQRACLQVNTTVRAFGVPLCYHCAGARQRQPQPLPGNATGPEIIRAMIDELHADQDVELGHCAWCKRSVRAILHTEWWRSDTLLRLIHRSRRVGFLVCEECWAANHVDQGWVEPYVTDKSETEISVAIADRVKKTLFPNAAQALAANRELRDEVFRLRAQSQAAFGRDYQKTISEKQAAAPKMVDPDAKHVAIAGTLAAATTAGLCAIAHAPLEIGAALVGTIAGLCIFLYHRATEVLDGQ